jgi:hypothetical protein
MRKQGHAKSQAQNVRSDCARTASFGLSNRLQANIPTIPSPRGRDQVSGQFVSTHAPFLFKERQGQLASTHVPVLFKENLGAGSDMVGAQRGRAGLYNPLQAYIPRTSSTQVRDQHPGPFAQKHVPLLFKERGDERQTHLARDKELEMHMAASHPYPEFLDVKGGSQNGSRKGSRFLLY